MTDVSFGVHRVTQADLACMLHAAIPNCLADDASGDALDAFLCLMQAA